MNTSLIRVCLPRVLFVRLARNYKRITEHTLGNVTTISAELVQSSTKSTVVPVNDPHGACPLCRLNMAKKLAYTDVLILRQFMRKDGTVLPKEFTGLCRKQQNNVEQLVMQAHWSGLFPSHKPDGFDHATEFSGYKRFQRYWNDPRDIYRLKAKHIDGSFHYVRRYGGKYE